VNAAQALGTALLVGLALTYVWLTRLYAKVLPNRYFGIGEYIYSLRISYRPIAVLMRMAAIAAYAALIFKLSGSETLAVHAPVVGGLLIVWPVVVKPEEWHTENRRFLLHASYFAFVAMHYVLSSLGVSVLNEASTGGSSAVLRKVGCTIFLMLIMEVLDRDVPLTSAKERLLDGGTAEEILPPVHHVAGKLSAGAPHQELQTAIEQQEASLFEVRPVLGASCWRVARLEELDEGLWLVYLEDGHVMHHAIVLATEKGEQIRVLWEQPDDDVSLLQGSQTPV